MVAKVIRVVDVLIALVAVALGCVALAGVSEDKDAIKKVYWSKITGEGGGLKVEAHFNLWGGVATLNADKLVEDLSERLAEQAEQAGIEMDEDEIEEEVEKELDDLYQQLLEPGGTDLFLAGLPPNEATEVDYDEQNAMYALVIIGFVLAVFKLIVAGVAVTTDNVGVGAGSTALSLLGIAIWFAALGLWVNEVMDGVDDEEGVELSYGPGLGSAAACGSLAVMSLILSIVACVVCGKEKGAPEAVSDTAKDLEMVVTK